MKNEEKEELAMTVTVYGDSILKGVVYDQGKYRMNSSWEHRLSDELHMNIRNRSRFGSTIQKAMQSLRKETASQPGVADGGQNEHVLLEFGGNDCDYDWAAISENPGGRYRCKTPPEVFATCYREAIEMIRQSGRRPIALNLPPIHSERYLDFICRRGLSKENILQWLGDVEAISRWQKTYSSLVTQLAREEQVDLIDLRTAFPTEPEELEKFLCTDGIHPSEAGQQRIYQTLRTFALTLGAPYPELV